MGRLVCSIIAALMLSACTPARRERFPALETAGQNVQQVLSSNGSLDRYRTAAVTFSAAVASASAATSDGRDRLERYRVVDKGLQDLLAVWEMKSTQQQELLPLSSPLPGRLAKEYQLPVNTNEPPSIYASEAMQAIWERTKATLAELDSPAQ